MSSPFFRFSLLLSICLFIIPTFPFIAHASVPPEGRFRYVNEGELGEYIVEYGADYRALDPFTTPFQLCFYNHTPNEFTLALRMGLVRSESLMRWVWEANRGNPVGENATLTLGEDGNLVLAHADGRIAWQTNTKNKGVVGFKILPDGNMVLYDSKGNFAWQSFDSPTDTLLVGQSLKIGGPNKLVSRASVVKNINGPYSLVMESKTLSMYYKSPNSPPPILYFQFTEWFSKQDLIYVRLNSKLGLETGGPGTVTFTKPRYNTTLTYMRLEMDGNLKFYTYELEADNSAWEVSYILFSRERYVSECRLPERCSNLGICEDSQCVACPSPNGLTGWTKDCKPAKVSCEPKSFRYYELQGVDHLLCKYTRGNGPMKQDSCASKCTSDCKCMGYFYHKETSRCWIANELKTLQKVGNSTHLAYIKTPTK